MASDEAGGTAGTDGAVAAPAAKIDPEEPVPMRHCEAIATDGQIILYKLDPDWRRSLRVVVSCGAAGPTRVHDFPDQRTVLHIGDLPRGETCRVSIMPRNFLKRMVARPTHLCLAPQNRNLRALFSGSGRCGTRSIAGYLDGLRFRDGTPVTARHETLYEYILPAIIAGDHETVRMMQTGFVHAIEAAPHFSLVPEAVIAGQVVRLIRDGRRVVQSGVNRGWYQNDRIWNRIKPDFPGTVFEKCCRFWVHSNQNLGTIAEKTVRLEDLAASAQVRRELLDFLEIEPSTKPFPAANKGRRPSFFDRWTATERDIFERICGELMDQHYPSWRRAS